MTDIPGNTSTTAILTVGGSATDSLEVLGDHDWYKITLTAGQSILITATTPDGTVDTYLNLYDPTGTTILAFNDDGPGGVFTSDSKIGFTATNAGTYFIDMGAWADDSFGAYTVSVQAWTPPPLATYDQIADELVNGYWTTNVGPGNAHHFDVTQGGTITVDIHTLTADEQNLARTALGEWGDIIGVNFQEVTSGAQITFDNSEDQSGPRAFTDATWGGDGITVSAVVHISSSWVNSYGPELSSYSFSTYLHEVGHALGLGHPGNYNFGADYFADALFLNDCVATTVMSYFDQIDNSYFANQHFDTANAETPMLADIAAMQQIYGLSTTTRTENTTYGFNCTADRDIFNASLYNAIAYTIFDSGGTDTLDYSGFISPDLINLNQETFSNIGSYIGNVSIGRGTVIENAIGGAGNNTLIGNSVANVLTGNAGDDTLNGNAGNDTLSGGAGNDSLDGGTGADAMAGGAGNDAYFVNSNGDTVSENSGEGTDLVTSSASFTLGANIENLTLTGASSLSGTGNSLANVINGNSGSNTINGGAGADTMAGGLGNDTYIVDNASDVVTESSGQGTDTVKSTISYTLGANLENLTLSGTAPNGTGNGLDNIMRGTNSANVLDGGAGNDLILGNDGDDTLTGGTGNDKLNGGTGNDTMSGGLGDDSYYVDSLSDAVTENPAEGTADKVISTITYTIGTNIERLMLYGAAAIDGTGNAVANVMYGNEADNSISGLAGADTIFAHGGNDTLIGGTGRDTLVGGAGNDKFAFDDGDFGGATTSTADRITDFASGDKIDLSAVDANSLVGGDQAFTFIGVSAFGNVAGQLHYEQISGNTYIEGDLNGDGVADFMIRADGLHALVGTDFVV